MNSKLILINSITYLPRKKKKKNPLTFFLSPKNLKFFSFHQLHIDKSSFLSFNDPIFLSEQVFLKVHIWFTKIRQSECFLFTKNLESDTYSFVLTKLSLFLCE